MDMSYTYPASNPVSCFEESHASPILDKNIGASQARQASSDDSHIGPFAHGDGLVKKKGSFPRMQQ